MHVVTDEQTGVVNGNRSLWWLMNDDIVKDKLKHVNVNVQCRNILHFLKFIMAALSVQLNSSLTLVANK